MSLDLNFDSLTKLKDWWSVVKSNFSFLDNRDDNLQFQINQITGSELPAYYKTNVLNYTTDPIYDGATNAVPAILLAAADTPAGGTLYFPFVGAGIYKHTENLILDLYPDLTIEFEPGAMWDVRTTLPRGNNTRIKCDRSKQVIWSDARTPLSQGTWRLYGATGEMFGALGDGVNDDTFAIIQAMNSTGHYKFLDGTYLIDVINYSPPDEDCIIVPPNIYIEGHPDAILYMKSNDYGSYKMMMFKDIDNVLFDGKGMTIQGDVDRHTPNGGEWGYGLSFFGCRNVTVMNVYTIRCWGDGVNIYPTTPILNTGGVFDLTLINVISKDNRRQAVSLETGRRLKFINCQFLDTGTFGGTSPQSGVDIECSFAYDPDPDVGMFVEDVTFEDCLIEGNNSAQFLVITPVRNLKVVRTQIKSDNATSSIYVNVGFRNQIDFVECLITGNSPILSPGDEYSYLKFTKCIFKASIANFMVQANSNARVEWHNCDFWATGLAKFYEVTASASEKTMKKFVDCNFYHYYNDLTDTQLTVETGYVTHIRTRADHEGLVPFPKNRFGEGDSIWNGTTGVVIDSYISSNFGSGTNAANQDKIFSIRKDLHMGVFDRAMDAISGDQVITTLGFKPKAILIWGGVSNTTIQCYGHWGDNLSGNSLSYLAAIAWAATDRIETANGGNTIVLSESSPQAQTGVISAVSNDGFTITWTRVGTPTAATAKMKYIAFR